MQKRIEARNLVVIKSRNDNISWEMIDIFREMNDIRPQLIDKSWEMNDIPWEMIDNFKRHKNLAQLLAAGCKKDYITAMANSCK